MGCVSSASRGAELEGPVGFKHFEKGRVLGEGGFGKVKAVTKRGESPSRWYAMKILNKENIVDRRRFAEVFRERDLLTALRHERICNLYYAFADAKHLYLVMDIALGGDLRYQLNHNAGGVPFSESRVRVYAAQLIEALAYVHSQGIIHRDVKPENLLLDAQGWVMLTDFGIARFVDEDGLCHSGSGTSGYMPPEVYTKSHAHTKTADWFALGVTIHELLTKRRPFRGEEIRRASRYLTPGGRPKSPAAHLPAASASSSSSSSSKSLASAGDHVASVAIDERSSAAPMSAPGGDADADENTNGDNNSSTGVVAAHVKRHATSDGAEHGSFRSQGSQASHLSKSPSPSSRRSRSSKRLRGSPKSSSGKRQRSNPLKLRSMDGVVISGDCSALLQSLFKVDRDARLGAGVGVDPFRQHSWFTTSEEFDWSRILDGTHDVPFLPNTKRMNAEPDADIHSVFLGDEEERKLRDLTPEEQSFFKGYDYDYTAPPDEGIPDRDFVGHNDSGKMQRLPVKSTARSADGSIPTQPYTPRIAIRHSTCSMDEAVSTCGSALPLNTTNSTTSETARGCELDAEDVFVAIAAPKPFAVSEAPSASSGAASQRTPAPPLEQAAKPEEGAAVGASAAAAAAAVASSDALVQLTLGSNNVESNAGSTAFSSSSTIAAAEADAAHFECSETGKDEPMAPVPKSASRQAADQEPPRPMDNDDNATAIAAS